MLEHRFLSRVHKVFRLSCWDMMAALMVGRRNALFVCVVVHHSHPYTPYATPLSCLLVDGGSLCRKTCKSTGCSDGHRSGRNTRLQMKLKLTEGIRRTPLCQQAPWRRSERRAARRDATKLEAGCWRRSLLLVLLSRSTCAGGGETVALDLAMPTVAVRKREQLVGVRSANGTGCFADVYSDV